MSDTYAQSSVVINLRDKTYEDSRERLKVNRPTTNAVDELGYIISDGIIVTPTVMATGGYDTNPDNLFDEKETAFGLVDNSLVFTLINPNDRNTHATTIALKSKLVNYENLDLSNRWDAGVTIDTYYAFPNGVEVSGGVLHLHDKVSYTENESTAGYYKLQYKNSFFETYTEGVAHQVRYLSQQTIDPSVSASLKPFLYNTEFNVNKTEKKAGILFNRNRMFSPYIEGGYAWIDYIDQKVAHTVNRDANEFWGTTGIRVTFIPQIRADLGYRYNKRDLDDTVYSTYETDYIDAKITWAPVENFRASFEVDRKLGVPSAAKSRLSKITSYKLFAQYKPSPRFLYSLTAYQKRTAEIGDNGDYRERGIASETTYDINNKTQFYINSLWSQLKEEISQNSYDRFKIGLGIRVKYNDAKSQPWANVWDELKQIPLNNKVIATSVGYGLLKVPSTKMTTVTDAFLTKTRGHIQDHNGFVDGARISVDLGQLQPGTTPTDMQTNLNFKGFYGHYSTKDISGCRWSTRNDCMFINIQDKYSNSDNNTGPFGVLFTRTKKQVDHWGVSVDSPILERVATNHPTHGAGYITVPTSWKFGISMKAIEQKTDLYGIDTSVPDPVNYDEKLDTYYYGVYASYNKHYNVFKDYKLKLNAEAGIYYADTNYEGKYVAFVPIGGSSYTLDTGYAQDDKQHQAFIGSLGIDLSRNVGFGTLSLIGKAEYYSYAPRVNYNDNDLGGGSVLDLVGSQVGTEIDEDHAFSFSVGSRMNIPLENILK